MSVAVQCTEVDQNKKSQKVPPINRILNELTGQLKQKYALENSNILANNFLYYQE